MEVPVFLEELIASFFSDPRVKTLAGLIVLDIVFGIAAAIRTGEFKWAEVLAFYTTMIVPYLMGYLGLYISAKYLLVGAWLGEWTDLAGEAFRTLAWGVLVYALAKSIVRNGKELGYSFMKEPEDLGPPTPMNPAIPY